MATALLATATTGGLTAFTRAHAARRDAAQLQHLHERAQYAFASLEPDLQMAGYFGGSATPAPLPAAEIPQAAQRCGLDPLRRLDLPVQVKSGWDLPCEARGEGAVDGSQVLVVRRVAARPAAAPEAGRAQWLSRQGRFPDGRLYWQGDAPPATVAGGQLRELIVRVYYVARAADGDTTTPALRVKSLTSIAGTPAFIDTEVMPGVENLQVELLPSAAAPRAAHLRLRIRADAGAAQAASPPRTLDISRLFALHNAPP